MIRYKVQIYKECFDSMIITDSLCGKHYKNVPDEYIYYQVVMDICIYKIDGDYYLNSIIRLRKLCRCIKVDYKYSGYLFTIYSKTGEFKYFDMFKKYIYGGLDNVIY